ncbi:MAG: hypothetical protein H6744_16315 [Deltaproteobacteria bacterium]|nr:hypothetical protein [Deltaproteobacteria bacterium]MCB9788248.1 hypothetical protein [Deltaproteobacteria bacterium]
MNFRSEWLAASACAALLVMACDSTEQRHVSPRSTLKVSLPEAPSLEPREVKARYPDGAWTVEGFLTADGHAAGEKAKVRGRVVEVFTCPKPPPPPPVEEDPNAPKPKPGEELPPPPPPKAPFCPQPPHMYLADAVGATRYQLLVVGSEATEVGRVAKGDEVTVDGSFDVMTRDGAFIRQAGLLVLPEPPPPPPPAEEPPPSP